mgnify:FL=1
MLKRVLTGAVILILTLGFVLLKQVSPLFFDAMVLIISIGSILEVSKAYKESGKQVSTIGLIFATCMFCIIFNLEKNLYRAFLYEFLTVLMLLAGFLTIDIITFAMNRKHGTTEPDVSKLNSELFDQTKYSMMALVYPVVVLSFLYAMNHMNYQVGYMGIITAFAVSMLTDTMALFIGIACGKTKFVPEVSPKKTVEGMIGGIVGGFVGSMLCFIVFYFTPWFALEQISLLNSLFAFIFVGIFGSFINQLGDLIASALKRKVGIKDYSHIFPAHGGFMDRVDGLMFTALFVYLIFALLLV